jgi:hypothetical protein
MASIFTLEGNDEGRRRRKRKRGRKRSSSLGSSKTPATLGDCKCVKAGRGGRRRKICFVGKSRKAPTGWLYQKGERGSCSR